MTINDLKKDMRVELRHSGNVTKWTRGCLYGSVVKVNRDANSVVVELDLTGRIITLKRADVLKIA